MSRIIKFIFNRADLKSDFSSSVKHSAIRNQNGVCRPQQQDLFERDAQQRNEEMNGARSSLAHEDHGVFVGAM